MPSCKNRNINWTENTVTMISVVLEMNSKIVVFVLLVTLALSVNTIDDYGCRKERCWSSCSATIFPNEWCYTTKGRSQDYNYVKCEYTGDCEYYWKCAGPCSIF